MIGLLAAAVLGGGVYALVRYGSSAQQPASLTADAKAYTRNLKLADVEMKATASYVGQEIVEILGKITNAGDRHLQHVELNCVFYDPYSQVVLRERVSIVRAKTGGLKPDETKSFRLAFDSIPQSWNKVMPQLVIASIEF